MDIKLSDRMKTIADLAEGNVVADIGCDHGLVSIYLANRGDFCKVIAMDLREGPLAGARENIARWNLSDLIEVRLSDGFEKLGCKEADCAIIAGMGGMLMTEILKRGRCHTDNGIRLVLQPQSDYDVVRKYLQSINYHIIDEEALVDEGKYYFAIKAECNTALECMTEYSEEELMYGPILLEKKQPVLKAYLEKEKKKKQELLASISEVETEKTLKRRQTLKREIDIINRGLARFEDK